MHAIAERDARRRKAVVRRGIADKQRLGVEHYKLTGRPGAPDLASGETNATT